MRKVEAMAEERLTVGVKLTGLGGLRETLAAASAHIDAARELLDGLTDGVELGVEPEVRSLSDADLEAPAAGGALGYGDVELD